MFRLIRRIKSLFSVQFAWIADHLTCYAVATPFAWSVLRGFKMDVEYVGPLLESAHDCFCNTVCAYINRRPNINRRPCLQSIICFVFVFTSTCIWLFCQFGNFKIKKMFLESHTKRMWNNTFHYPKMGFALSFILFLLQQKCSGHLKQCTCLILTDHIIHFVGFITALQRFLKSIKNTKNQLFDWFWIKCFNFIWAQGSIELFCQKSDVNCKRSGTILCALNRWLLVLTYNMAM